MKPIRSPAAAEAENKPPSCISRFRHTAVPLEPKALNLAIDFELGCGSCSNDVFGISAFPLAAPDPSPYADIAPGEIFYRPPHTLKCTACGAENTLFDARTHGYDAVLNNSSGYESGTEGKSFIQGSFRIVVGFAYNVIPEDLEELRGAAKEANVALSDLFDWITISARATDDSNDIELSYECA